MRILLTSHAFSPQVGGLETVARLLAEQFVAAGHELRICTRSEGSRADDLGFHVIRNPSKSEYLAQVKWSEAVLQNNISLPWAIPLVLRRKPWVCGNHNWPRADDGSLSRTERVKLIISRLAPAQTAVSHALAAQLSGSPVILGNPYDADRFHVLPEAIRDRDVVFVGRLYDGKGVDVLLKAVAALKPLTPTVTVIGSGPAKEELEQLIVQLGLESQVVMKSGLPNEQVVNELNRHTLFVLPSRLRESFGVVILEAMACGCIAVGSECGGIPEAVGAGGPIFPVDDVPALTPLLQRLLTDPKEREDQLQRQTGHLAQFAPAAVAARYLNLLEKVARR